MRPIYQHHETSGIKSYRARFQLSYKHTLLSRKSFIVWLNSTLKGLTHFVKP